MRKLLIGDGETENIIAPSIHDIYTQLADKLNSNPEIEEDSRALIESLFTDISGTLAIKYSLGELNGLVGNPHRSVYIPCNTTFRKIQELGLWGKYGRSDLVQVVIKKAVDQIARELGGFRVESVSYIEASSASIKIFIDGDVDLVANKLFGASDPK